MTTKDFMLLYKDLQCFVAVGIGIITQIFYTEIKTKRNYLTIIISSSFIALTIIPFVLELLAMKSGSVGAVAIYATSSLISVKLIMLMDKHIPKLLKRKIKRR